jgi:2-polyprenyl-3-methyl-5-hydroxy-6-metoxy-1,4-benzoquinol methylase
VARDLSTHITPRMTMPIRSFPTSQGDVRFQFGKNWARFLASLDDQRIAEAERSLTEMLEVSDLRGRSFLDAGSGSGLFSLAAKRLGAARVHSFDYDEDSVACTRELKRRFFPDDANWTIEHASVLDATYLRARGTFDVVYSWGVLHHTGDLWQGLANVADSVQGGGYLFVAIYNDQGGASRRWLRIKRAYSAAHLPLKVGLVLGVGIYSEVRQAVGRALRLENPLPFKTWRDKKRDRGMSVWHDLVDWVGGYPFEVAKPEDVFDFCRARRLILRRLKTAGGGFGNNQFVFVREVD